MNKYKKMMFWELLIIVAIIWTMFSTITDLKKREVPNWISFTLIAIALFSRIIYSIINSQSSIFIYGILGLAIGVIIGCLMYYTKQWGGGDAKLLMGLTTIFIDYKGIEFLNANIDLPFILILLINIMLFGGIYGFCYGLMLAAKNKEKFLHEWNKHKHTKIIIALGIMIILPLLVYSFIRPLFYIISALGVLAFVLIIMLEIAKTVETVCMYKKINPNKLVEGDWIAEDVKKGKEIIYKSSSIELKQKDIDLIKKNKIKEVLIREGIPFIPGFLIGLIVSLVFGNWII